MLKMSQCLGDKNQNILVNTWEPQMKERASCSVCLNSKNLKSQLLQTIQEIKKVISPNPEFPSSILGCLRPNPQLCIIDKKGHVSMSYITIYGRP